MVLKNRKIKIIIADDNESFLEGIQVLLSGSGKFEVIAVYRDGSELIESHLLQSADLIISDILMPHMNGIEAARIINYTYYHIPMIALTMYKDRLYLDDIIGAGFKGFVYKPDTVTNLLSVIEKVLNNRFAFPSDIKVK